MRQQHTEYHKDGSMYAQGELVDGQPDGYWEWFRKDGTKMRSGSFNKGKQVGEWTTYDKTGKVVKITSFDSKNLLLVKELYLVVRNPLVQICCCKHNYNWEAVHIFWLKWPICRTDCLWQPLIAQKMTENRS